MQLPEIVCKRQHNAPYVEGIVCICSNILAGNKTTLIIPDLTLQCTEKIGIVFHEQLSKILYLEMCGKYCYEAQQQVT